MNIKEHLSSLDKAGNLRRLPKIIQEGKWVIREDMRMLNLSSNDYLGLASGSDLQQEFLDICPKRDLRFSSSSSRLLTGNFPICEELEEMLSTAFGKEAALLFNSGYHANTGILPALSDKSTLIVADKLVHASLIDGMLLGSATFRRFPHQDLARLEKILEAEASQYEKVFVVVESVYSMDGDVTDLRHLVALKKKYPNVMLYVDEAHAIGVRGKNGLGIAEEQDCIADIDLLVGTFGKALASMGAYVVCTKEIREYLVNTMRPLIFSTALPPFQWAWTAFVFSRLKDFSERRDKLSSNSSYLASALNGKGGEISESHIVPLMVGDSAECIIRAEYLQRKGFYCMPVRPPTVPKGTSRIRFSLTANVEREELETLVDIIKTSLASSTLR